MHLRYASIMDYDSGDYVKLFTDVFGYYDHDHIPGITIIAEDGGEAVGFLTGYWRTRRCFHIYYSGLAKKASNPVSTAKLLKDCISFLGNPNCMAVIENTNRAAMMAAFRAGFTPIGMRFDGGKTLVEWALGG